MSALCSAALCVGAGGRKGANGHERLLKFRSLNKEYEAGPGGRAVYCVGLRSLNCWDRGF